MTDVDEHLAQLFALLDARWAELLHVDGVDVEIHDRDASSVFLRVNLHSFVQTPLMDERLTKKERHSIIRAIYESHQPTTVDPFSQGRRPKNAAELAVDAATLTTSAKLYPPNMYPIAHEALTNRRLEHPHAPSFAVFGGGGPEDAPSGKHTKHMYFTSEEKPEEIFAALVDFAPHILDMHAQRPDPAHHVNDHPLRGDHVVRDLRDWRQVFARPT